MTTTWRKIENENGFTFYINKNDKKQWDHPKYAEVKLKLDDCNYIKFASYRIAHKFRVLQHSLNMNDVPLSIIKGVFDRHKLGTTENTLRLESCDLEAVLSDIFFAANKHNHMNIDVDTATELTLNFIYNIFDCDRERNVEVLPSKLTLAILSQCSMKELNHFIFTLCCDHNNCVTRLRLQTVLSKISAITNYLNETVSFDQHLVNSSIGHCFNNSPGLVGIDESAFCSWLENVPQIFSWLPILHRIKLSESVVHKAKCCVCKVNPIIGMKYKCVKCTKYVQCQRCFLTGGISNSHKLTHVMKEQCKENSKHFRLCFTNRVFKLLKCKYRVSDSLREDITVLDNKPLDGVYKELLLESNDDEVPCNIVPLSSPLSQLQVIIRQLEIQNKQLHAVLTSSHKSDANIKQYVEQHRQHVANQVQKLKMLQEQMSHSRDEKLKNIVEPSAPFVESVNHYVTMNQVQSTPMVRNSKSISNLRGLNLFSPIHQVTEPLSEDSANGTEDVTNHAMMKKDDLDYSTTYTMKDISTWLGGHSNGVAYQNELEKEFNKSTPEQTDLDDALAKLQQILANNFSLDESLGSMDNGQLKTAVNEVEGVLSSIIDTAEYTGKL
ncbi:dystrophin-related protein 2-like isoform X2 [Atheta coriaria]|uniref:dystrophin-related protein 2-like isoform X2 n=1 Tax=Dalotia coriaria TaxID=877792 RepID=UPI0031F3E8AE